MRLDLGVVIAVNKAMIVGVVAAVAAMTAIGGTLVAVGAAASALAWAFGGLGIIWTGLAVTASLFGRTVVAPFSMATRVVNVFRAGLQRLALPLKAIPALVGRVNAAFATLGSAAAAAASRAAAAVGRIAVGIGRSLSGLGHRLSGLTVRGQAATSPTSRRQGHSPQRP